MNEVDPLSPRNISFRERLDVAKNMAQWIRARGLWWAAPMLLGLFFFSLILFLASSSTLAPFFYAIF